MLNNSEVWWFVVEDNTLFQSMFQSATESLDDYVELDIFTFSDDAEKKYKEIKATERPNVVFIDINLDGSSFDGLELLRRINFELGNEIVIGIISTSEDEIEIARAVKAGAQFWIKKSGDLEEILPKFIKDIPGYENRTNSFTIYS